MVVVPAGKRDDHRVNIRATELGTLNLIPIHLAETEPPFTMAMSDDEILSLIDKPLECSLPLNSVAVERAVKEVTRAAARATNNIERDGLIQMTIKSRNS